LKDQLLLKSQEQASEQEEESHLARRGCEVAGGAAGGARHRVVARHEGRSPPGGIGIRSSLVARALRGRALDDLRDEHRGITQGIHSNDPNTSKHVYLRGRACRNAVLRDHALRLAGIAVQLALEVGHAVGVSRVLQLQLSEVGALVTVGAK